MSDQQERVCECCGLKLTRKRFNGRLEDRTAFTKRRFCTLACANVRRPEAKERRAKSVLDQQKKEADKLPVDEPPLTPLEYMLKVMNDPRETPDRRARMAIAAAPYVHPKATVATGKKALQEQAARKATTGRFAPAPGPKIIPIR